MFLQPQKENRPTGILALHDVSPRWDTEIDTAMNLLRGEFNLRPALFVVPDFHGQYPIDRHTGFISKINNWLVDGCELMLHGYHHICDHPVQRRQVTRYARAKLLTANEGEFLNLSPSQIDQRLKNGLEMLRVFNHYPVGFVAPAWLYNRHLAAALIHQRIAFHEGHLKIYHLLKKESYIAPAITFCARGRFRTHLSSDYANLAGLALQKGFPQQFRLALHPVDFQSEQLIGALRRMLRKTEARVQWLNYTKVLGLQ